MMANEKGKKSAQTQAAAVGPKESVRAFQRRIAAEKAKMGTYSKKMASNVRELTTSIRGMIKNNKEAAKKMHEAAASMRVEGIRTMKTKVAKFKEDIVAQKNENRDAVARISSSVKSFRGRVKYFNTEIRAHTAEVQAYAKAFWG